MKRSRKAPASSFWTEVPARHLKRLIEKELAYSEYVRKNRVRYPDRDSLHLLTDVHIKRLGFSDHDLSDVWKDDDKGVTAAAGGKKKGKGGAKLVSPATMLAEVLAALNNAGIQPVNGTGDAVWAEHNFLNCQGGPNGKVTYYKDTYKELISRADLIWCVEVSKSAIADLAKISGYLGFCCTENSRGQAVGFLVNPKRYKVIGQAQEWTDVANVQGIPDLRPAFHIELEDLTDGWRFGATVVHLKSMRGGPRVTGPVRYQQCLKIANHLGQAVVGCKPKVGKYQVLNFYKNVKLGRALSDHGFLLVRVRKTAGVALVNGMQVLAGDWNDFLNTTHVTAPIVKKGYPLVYPNNSTSTQQMGGRLDGWYRDLPDATCSGSVTSGPFSDDPGEDPELSTQ